MTDNRLLEIQRGLAHRSTYGTQHKCHNCGLTEEEEAWTNGYNAAVGKLQPVIKELLEEIWMERVKG